MATAGAGALVLALKKITDESIQTALELKKLKAETGVNLDEFQRWTAVADQVSNSGDAIAASIRSITSNQEKIKLGQGNISGFQLLGIDPHQDPFKILEQVREKTKNLSQAMKKNVLEQMGISKDMIQVLELSKDKFDEIAKSAWVVPESTIESIDRIRAASKQLNNAFKFLKMTIAGELAPSIIKINKLFMEWIRNNKEGLIKTIKVVFDWLYKLVRMITDVLSLFNKLIKSTIGWDNVMKIISGSLLFLLSPLGLFTAALLFLFAVIDDIARFNQGRPSLLGELIDEGSGFGKFLKGIVDIFDAFNKFFSGDNSKMDELIEKWGAWGEILQMSAEALTTLHGLISKDVNTKTGAQSAYVKKRQNKAQMDYIEKYGTNWGSSIASYKEGVKAWKEIMENEKTGKFKDNDYINPNNSTVINNNVKVDIQGNAGKEEVKQGVNDGLKEGLKSMDAQFAD